MFFILLFMPVLNLIIQGENNNDFIELKKINYKYLIEKKIKNSL